MSRPCLLVDVGGVLILASGQFIANHLHRYGVTRTAHECQRAVFAADREGHRRGDAADYWTDGEFERVFGTELRLPTEVNSMVWQFLHDDDARVGDFWSEVDPDAATILGAARMCGWQVAAVSQATGRLSAELTRAGLHHLINVSLDSATTPFNKPDVRLYCRALELAGADPATTVYLADQPRDLDGARRAGVSTLFLIDRNGLYPDRPWYRRIRSLAQLTVHLESIYHTLQEVQ